MNGLIGLGGTLALLLVIGGVLGAADRRHFAPRWLVAAALLVALNDAALTRVYGMFPDVIGGDWNWQGKVAALAVTLAVAAAVGGRQAGLTLAQTPGSLRAALPVAAAYGAFFVIVALALPGGRSNAEEIAFQSTMPGLEEELFYRGVLLLVLDRAFTARRRLFGVDWGWGAVLSCLLFGLAHAFGYARGAFAFDPMTMALTALPAVIAVWLRYRTGSVLLPILLHNLGNVASLIV